MFKLPLDYCIERHVDGAVYLINRKRRTLRILASSGMGWEHVSVSTSAGIPRWEDMCFAKDFFWDLQDLVVQLHVPKSDWINDHPDVLHLWRKTDSNSFCELPPKFMV